MQNQTVAVTITQEEINFHMLHHYADDGRIMTPPKELEPLLKGSFSAFSKLIGHIRFFYIADEIWDGQCSLAFNADGAQLAAFTLADGVFDVYLQPADQNFTIKDEASLDVIIVTLKKTIPINKSLKPIMLKRRC